MADPSASARPQSSSTSTSRRADVHALDLSPIDAAARLDTDADRLLTERDFDGALHALQKAIYLRPDHTLLHAKLARVYWDLGDLKSAMACYRKLLSIDPNPTQRIKDQFASLLDLHGFTLLRLGESPAIAIAYLSEAIQLNSLEEAFWLHRALAHIETGHLDKAVRDVDHCINLNGKDVEYFVLRAKLHWKLHLHEKATHDIHRAAQLSPTHPEVVEHERRVRTESQTIYAKARRHVLVRAFDDAIKCLTQAAELSPLDTKIYLLRASAHREKADLAAATSDVDKALSCHAHQFETAKKHKVAKRRDHHEATDDVDRSREYREIATLRSLILNDRALGLLRDASFALALNALNQVMENEKDLAARYPESRGIDAQYFVNRGDAYRGLGNLQAALADYHHALELAPTNVRDVHARVALVHYHFGIALFNDTHFARAEVEFANAIKHDDVVATYFVRKGDAARFQEKHDVARDDYIAAFKLAPNDSDTRNKLQQYAIDPAAVLAAAAAEAQSPQRRVRSDPLPSPSAAPSIHSALQAAKQKHKRVQDLYHARPAIVPKQNGV